MENPLSIQCLSPAPPELQRPILALNQLHPRAITCPTFSIKIPNLVAMKWMKFNGFPNINLYQAWFWGSEL